MKIEVSVIIPFYKKTIKQLKRAVDSVMDQADEIIVINDGDRHLRLKFDKKVKLHQYKKNAGANYARNKGIILSKGKYILFLDPDDWLECDVIPLMIDALNKYKHYSYVYGNYSINRILHKCYPFDEKKLKENNYIPMTTLIRANKMILFDEMIKRFQDWDLWLSMAEKGRYGLYINKTIFNAERDETSKSMKDDYAEMLNIVKMKHGLEPLLRRVWRGSRWVMERVGKPLPAKDEKIKIKAVAGRKVVIIFVSKDLTKITLKFLKSIVNNTKYQYELIWVDNGSKMSSRRTVLSYIEKNIKNYKYIWNSSNEGWVWAINEALQIIKDCDYVVLCNNDIEVPKGWLGKLLGIVELNDEFGLVGPVANEGIIGWQRINYLSEHIKMKKYTIVPFPLAFFCVLIRKELIDKLGGLSRKFGKYGLGEDDYFCKKAEKLGYKSVITTECVVKHLHRTTFKNEKIDYYKLQIEHADILANIKK